MSGSLADLGVLVPITAALVLHNGFDAATVLVGVGALYLAAGLWFRVPVPVQPIKAAAAIAIARSLPPAELSVAGILLGLVLVGLRITRFITLAERIFTTPIVRGIQLGVGLILIRTSLHLASAPTPVTLMAAGAIALLMLILPSLAPHFPAALILVVGGAASTLVLHGWSGPLRAALWHPRLVPPPSGGLVASALVVLVLPQLPLTLGNAVLALADVEHRYFGESATRITPQSIAVSCGVANVAAGLLGGMPMCHGSGGLTAHYRAGARTWRMNAVFGAALLVFGLIGGPAALAVLRLVPAPVLMGLLAFTGVAHASLAGDRRGFELLVAVVMGGVGLVTSNLALALGAGVAMDWGRRAVERGGARLARGASRA